MSERLTIFIIVGFIFALALDSLYLQRPALLDSDLLRSVDRITSSFEGNANLISSVWNLTSGIGAMFLSGGFFKTLLNLVLWDFAFLEHAGPLGGVIRAVFSLTSIVLVGQALFSRLSR